MKKSDEIRNVYDEIADLYDEVLWNDMPYNDEIDKFVSLLNGRDVLDIGCAMGSFTKYVSDKGYNVDGIDISPKLIEIAKRKVPSANFQVMDMLDLKIDKLYDGIMFINSTIHVEKKDMLDMFKNVSKLLKEDGTLFIILLEGEGEMYVEEPLKPSIKEFVNFYTKNEIETLFRKSHFSIIESHSIIDDADTELGSEQLVYYLRKENILDR